MLCLSCNCQFLQILWRIYPRILRTCFLGALISWQHRLIWNNELSNCDWWWITFLIPWRMDFWQIWKQNSLDQRLYCRLWMSHSHTIYYCALHCLASFLGINYPILLCLLLCWNVVRTRPCPDQQPLPLSVPRFCRCYLQHGWICLRSLGHLDVGYFCPKVWRRWLTSLKCRIYYWCWSFIQLYLCSSLLLTFRTWVWERNQP